jgi:hypothetical protein
MKSRLVKLSSVVLVAVLVIGLLLSGCTEPSDGDGEVESATVQTSGVGGGFYITAVAIGAIASKYSDLSVNAEPGPGSDATARILRDGLAEMGIINGFVARQAYDGVGGFEGEDKVYLRFISSGLPSVMGIFVRADSGIESITDLQGKKVQDTTIGNTIYETYMAAVLEAYGMDWNDITHVPVTSAREGADLFIAGSVDAWLISGCYPPSPLNVEVSETIDVKLLTLGEDESEEISEMLPWSSPEVIPADSYKGQEEDVLSHGHRTVWVSEREVPEDIVYKVTKAVYDNFEEFQGISSDLLAYWSLEAGAIDNPSVPVHPGAIQYYEEIDVWTAQLEELNQSMLDVET